MEIIYKIREKLKMKYKAPKFKPELCNSSMQIHEVILAHYPKFNHKISVNMLYMPQEEQDKMSKWIMKNLKSFKRMSAPIKKRQMAWVQLDIFPSAVK